jgi:hypothetical protein
MKKTLLILLFAIGVCYWGWGQVTLPHLDPINYTVGQALQTQTGWTTLNSGDNLLIASGSLSYSGLATPSYNKVTFDGAGIDAAKLFTQQSSGTVYYSFLLNVTALGSLNTTGGYFTGFTEGAGTTFGATVWSRSDGAGFDLGLNPRTTATNTVWSTGTTPINTTLLIVISYQLVSGTTNDIVKMWINPTPGSTEPSATLTATNTLTDLANLNRILIRQDATTTTPFIEMDELRIGTTWADVTPSSVVGTPTKLTITTVNGGSSPTSGLPFSVVIQAQDNNNSLQPVTSDVNISLSGIGIGGTTSGTITNGESNVTISGVNMSEGYGLTITATQTSGTPVLTAGTSSSFYVMSTTPNYRTKASGNWSIASTWEIQISGNWYDAVEYPNASSKNATILNSHIVSVTDNSGIFNNLTVDVGGKVWVGSTTTRFFNSYGNITCNGTIGDAGGTDGLGIDIEGVNCSISGNGLIKISRMAKFTANNLTTNLTINSTVSLMYTHATNSALYNFNPSSTTFNITLNPSAQLSVPNAKIDLTGCNLILKSNATGTASLIDNGTISGQTGTNVTVERYLTEDTWHYISAPISNSTANVFFGIYMIDWNEPTELWSFITNPSYSMSVMKGYSVWSQSGMTGNTTVAYTGNLNTDAPPIDVYNTPGSPPEPGGPDEQKDYTGMNFVGNPYPSAIDWNVDDGYGWTRTNIGGSIYIWNGVQYGSYNETSGGTNGVDNIIPAHQGFFVYCYATSGGLLGVDNRARIHNDKEIFKSTIATDNPIIKLKVEGNGLSDESLLQINSNASVNFDEKFDANKWYGVNTAPQLFTLSKEGKELSINCFPESEEYQIIPVGLKVGLYGLYEINITEFENINSSYNIYLEDLKEGTFTKLDQSNIYSFTASPMDDPMRFLLHLNGQLAVPENNSGLSGVNVYSYNQDIYINSENSLNGTAIIYDLLGREILRKNLNGESVLKINLNDHKGYMIVNVTTEQGMLNQKVYIR